MVAIMANSRENSGEPMDEFLHLALNSQPVYLRAIIDSHPLWIAVGYVIHTDWLVTFAPEIEAGM